MKIGIATVTYNTEKYIKQNIDSIKAQIFDGEIVQLIVDNGSTDSTVEMLEELGVDYISIKENTGGGAKPYNVAFKELAKTCDYIWRIDSDDYLSDPLAVQKMADRISRGDYDWVNCHCQSFGADSFELRCMPNATANDFKFVNQLTAFGMFKPEVLIDSGGFDTHPDCGYEDWEFWIRLLKMGYRYGIVTDPIYAYRLYEGQHHKNLGIRHQTHVEYIQRKHFR